MAILCAVVIVFDHLIEFILLSAKLMSCKYALSSSCSFLESAVTQIPIQLNKCCERAWKSFIKRDRVVHILISNVTSCHDLHSGVFVLPDS